MIGGRIWIGVSGSEVLFESGWTNLFEADVRFDRKERTANASLVIDTIATKKQFDFTYGRITQADLDAWLTEVERDVTLNLKVEREDLSVNEYLVSATVTGRSRLVARGDWLWGGVTFILEEV